MARKPKAPKREQHPVARAKMDEAMEVARRAIEGGFASDIVEHKWGWKMARGAKAREFAERLRGLLEGLGVRVLQDPRRTIAYGITLHCDVAATEEDPAGMFVGSPGDRFFNFLVG